MNYRNAKFLASGWIDCEIDHPKFGWIPFTADPADTGAQFDVAALHGAMSVDANTLPYTPPTAEQLAEIEAVELQRYRASLTLSFAQLLIGLVAEGWITEEEGDSWVDGILPDKVVTLINDLPADQQFAARTRAKRPSEILRTDFLVSTLGQLEGKTDQEMDEFFAVYKNA
jgi:hypothetical protein